MRPEMQLLIRDLLPIEVAHLSILVMEISDLWMEVKVNSVVQEVPVNLLLMAV